MNKEKDCLTMNKIEPLVDALKRYKAHYDNEGADYSVTDLIQPPRITLLKNRHWIEILSKPVNPEREIDSFSGTALHAFFEANLKHKSKYLLEERMSEIILDRHISGCPDILDLDLFYLYDLKMSKAWKKVFSGFSEWEQQLNLYTYFFWLRKKKVKKLFILAWWKGFDKNVMLKNYKYPREPVEQISIKLWDFQQQEDFLYERLGLLLDAEPLADEDLPECTPKERWDRASAWAVYKFNKAGKRMKKAARVLYSETDIERWIKKNISEGTKYIVEVRPGLRERCENWCSCSDFCSQYKIYMEAK